jgi:alpha-L-fucosidase
MISQKIIKPLNILKIMNRFNVRNFALVLLIAILFIGCSESQRSNTHRDKIHYQENWESLFQHNEEPDWFKDAKFGIYFHWGVYSVPAFGNEWYPRWMHFENPEFSRIPETYTHHLEKYGHPSEFGYHDFIPKFKAEHFDAEDWADLFKKAGARFAGPVAEHHDGFSMWASKTNPWNAYDMGPNIDITGKLEKAIKGRDMKFITTFHHARQLQRYKDKPDEQRFNDSHYPYFQGMPPVTTDEKLRILYGNIPEEEWLETQWFGKLKEVIDNYQPDIMWFDSWLDRIPENYLKKYLAYYLNEAENWGKEVVIVRKQDDLPLEVSVNDLEKSRMNRMGEKVWMSDETLSTGSWCYTENLVLKNSTDVLHVLIDITSKNGVLLLNISPMANGVIPEDQRQALLDIGDWLEKFGESIYNTRPWYTYGEGPTSEPEGHFSNREEFLKLKYTPADVRFTTLNNNIYAIIMGKPEANSIIKLESFAKVNLPEPLNVRDVSLLGSRSRVNWNMSDQGLEITVPDEITDSRAVVFKIVSKK